MIAVLQLNMRQKNINLGETFSIEKPPNFKNNTQGNTLIFPCVLFKKYAPFFINCWVICRVFKVFLNKKIIVFKFKRRKNYRRRYGHRTNLVMLQAVAFMKQL